MNLKIVSYFLGWVLLIEAIAMVIPLVIALALGESSWIWFLVSIGAVLIPGLLLSRKKMRTGNFFVREGYVATALGWIVLSLMGTLPFILSGKIPRFVDALFEITSGFTTTGASILNDVEELGYGLLFWRSFSHWLGGMGVLVLILAVLPMSGGYNMQVMKAESPGPSVSKLVPRVSDTAKVLYLIYLGLTVMAIISYMITGMPVFDAVCIGVGTAGTGGFAVRATGLNGYSSASQTMITIFMLLFGVNFNVYYLILRKKFRDALKSEEVRVYLAIFTLVVITLTILLKNTTYQEQPFYYSLHHTAFTTASLLTSTGFGTVDFVEWPAIGQTILMMVMFCGACAVSTGGGIKVSRMLILVKEGLNEIHLLIHPKAVRAVRLDGKTVESDVVRSINRYMVLYAMIFVISVFVVSFDGYDFHTNFSAVLTTLNNMGPGFSRIGPTSNFAEFSDLSKLVLTFDMLAGRLELIPMVMLFYKQAWSRHF